MEHIRKLLQKMRLQPGRWGLFLPILGLAGLAVFLLPLDAAIPIHAYAGYYFCVAVFAVLIWTSVQVFRGVESSGFFRQRWKGLIFVILAAVFVHLHKPHMMRVFNDEPAHQMVAKQFHEARSNSVPEVGYHLQGGLAYGERSLNYRMYFYPFVVSLVHDLTGFRVGNGLWVNAAFGLLLFLSVYLGGNKIYPRAGGLLAVLLVAGLPLIDESVTSYGYDTANLFFVSLFFLALSLYAERSDDARLNWLVATGLALAYSRNESLLYFLAAAAVVAYAFFRKRDAQLTWFAALSPVLLLPVLAARSIFRAVHVDLSVMFPHLESDQFFSFGNIPVNFARVGDWLFELSTSTPSYPLLSLLGVIGLVALISSLLGDLVRKKSCQAQDGALVLFFVVVLGSFFFVTLALFWNPVAGEAARFLLPLHLAFAYAAVWLSTRSARPQVLASRLVIIASLGVFLMAVPTKMRLAGGANTVFARYADWSLDWLEANDDQTTLYLSQLHTLFLLYEYPSMDLTRANQNFAKVAQLQAEDYYGRIVVFVIEKFDSQTGRWMPPSPARPLSERFVTQPLAERRWAYNQRARFLELTGYRKNDGEVVAIEDLPSLRLQYPSYDAYRTAMLRLHPGYPWSQ